MSDHQVFRVVKANGEKVNKAVGGGALYDNLPGAKAGCSHFDRSQSQSAPHRLQSLELEFDDRGTTVSLVWEDVSE